VPAHADTPVPAARKVAIQRLVEVAVGDLEARLSERVLARCAAADNAVKRCACMSAAHAPAGVPPSDATAPRVCRLSKRLSAELGGAHSMITAAMHDQSAATEALRADLATRIQDDSAAALATHEELRATLQALQSELGRVRPRLARLRAIHHQSAQCATCITTRCSATRALVRARMQGCFCAFAAPAVACAWLRVLTCASRSAAHAHLCAQRLGSTAQAGRSAAGRAFVPARPHSLAARWRVCGLWRRHA
jgi:hypothetical protein